jgi:NAD+ diphosphatase
MFAAGYGTAIIKSYSGKKIKHRVIAAPVARESDITMLIAAKGVPGMTFSPSITTPGQHSDLDLMFVFQRDLLLVRNDGDSYSIPNHARIRSSGISLAREFYIGSIDGVHCYAAEPEGELEAPPDWRLEGMRFFFRLLPPDIIRVAGRAFQVLYWDSTNRFCGRCGAATAPKDGERAKVCPSCGLEAYPKISPVIIVAVVREGKLLLASSRAYRRNFYSLLAGYVEPGESFEECVKREVKEEVGIEVDDIRYFGSQPWPFPSSLIAGFTARHSSGELRPDGVEINDAGWYEPQSMPPIPPPGSISRMLIDWFVSEYGGNGSVPV